MSDSDGEIDVDKEQLRRLEENDIKTDKKAKKRKRMEKDDPNRLNDSDSGSALSSEAEEEAAPEEGIFKGDGKKKADADEKVVEHKPLKKS